MSGPSLTLWLCAQVPFCCLAVLERLSGVDCVAVDPHTLIPARVVDPYLPEVRAWGYQSCQPHQKAVIDAAAALHRIHADPTAAAAEVPAAGEWSAQEQGVRDAIAGLLATVDPSRRANLLSQIKE